MADFSSNIIIVVWLSNLISELTMSGHGFELNQQQNYFKIHGGARLQISEFEKPTAHMSITIEEPPEFVFEFREFCFTRITLIPLNIMIQNVNCFRFEKLTEFFVLVNKISQPHLFDVGVNTFVS
jgi:hypothetical protein